MERGAVLLADRLGEWEPAYRSRGEAQVGRLLQRYDILFLYEEPTLVYDRGRTRIWRPDFTLPAYGGLIVEYAGMPEKSSYMAGVRHKQRAYAANRLPAMFVYPDDIRGPRWPERLVERIRAAGSSARDVPTPRAPPAAGAGAGTGAYGR